MKVRKDDYLLYGSIHTVLERTYMCACSSNSLGYLESTQCPRKASFCRLGIGQLIVLLTPCRYLEANVYLSQDMICSAREPSGCARFQTCPFMKPRYLHLKIILTKLSLRRCINQTK